MDGPRPDPPPALRVQRCDDCGHVPSLQRLACPQCGSARLSDRPATGGGIVHAVTVVARAPDQAFRALVPYTLVLVDLDEGARVMAHGTPGLRIGDRVRACSGPTVTGHTLVLFRPDPAQEIP